MKILHLPFALFCGLSTIRDAYAAEPEASCQDDHKYTYLDNDEVALTCGEIREFDETRQELCVIEEVKTHCPFSCGICCEEHESYIINCEWIAEEGWRKVEYCGQTFEHRMVQEMCPIACDYCMDHVDGTETSAPTSHPVEKPKTPAPHGSTKAPSKAPSGNVVPSSSKAPTSYEAPSSKVPTLNTPAPVPNGAVDVTFEYVIPDMCAWVAASKERIERFCGQSSDASAEVFAKCPATCSQFKSRPNAYPCSDLPDTYTFPALWIDRLRTCSWVAKRGVRIYRYCTPERQLTACAMTCGVCDLAATSYPSLSISPSSSSAPSNSPLTSSVPSSSSAPSRPPSPQPSPFPTLRPTTAPSMSNEPSSLPSTKPSRMPSDQPSQVPSKEPSRSPSSVPSEPPTLASFVFSGIEDAFSTEKGKISVAWSRPLFYFEETENDVQYHLFIVAGEPEFHFDKNMPETFINSTEFESFRDDFLTTDAHHYAVTSSLDYIFEGTQYNQTHSLLVIAEWSEFYSTNRRASDVIMSATSPLLYEGVVINGFYFPTELLSISLSDFGDLVFRGPLLQEHLNVRTGEFISGLTSSLEIFFVRIAEVNLIQEDLVYLSVATADPLEEVYKEIHISFRSLLRPQSDDDIVNLQRGFLHTPSDIFIGDKNTGILDAQSFSSIDLYTGSRNLKEIWNKEFEFGFNKGVASLEGTFTLTVTGDVEKKFHEGKVRTTITVGYTKELTVEASIGAELAVNKTFNDPKDDDYKPLWEGTEHSIWAKGVRFVFKPKLGGWIKFEGTLKMRAFYISRTIVDSGSVTISTGGLTQKAGNEEPSSGEKDDEFDLGSEVSGEVDITATLQFAVDVSVYHEKLYKIIPDVTANLNFNAVAELYTFPWRLPDILALSAFDLKLYFGANLSGESKLLKKIYDGGKFDMDFGEFLPIKIFSLPEVEWTEGYTQECHDDKNGKQATIKGIGLKDLGSDDTILVENYLLQNTDEWYASTIEWDPPVGIQNNDFEIELRKELSEDVLVAPAISNLKVYAFIKAKIPGDRFLPVVYTNDLISVPNAACPTKIPTPSPTPCLDEYDFQFPLLNRPDETRSCNYICRNPNHINYRHETYCSQPEIASKCCLSCASGGCSPA